MIEIGVTDQNYGLWSWFPLSIFRRFELLTRLAPVVHGLSEGDVEKDVFCVVALRQKGRRWKFGMSIIYLNINSNKWSSFQENDLPVPRFH